MAVALIFFALVVLAHPSTATDASRIRHLESLVRCPVCTGLSVGESNTTSSVAIRHEIADKVHAGKSDSEILTSLESRYGVGILLSPPTRGVGVLLWVIPVFVLLLGGLLLVRVVTRER